jgi:uncharacterized cupredoxin-like copper-binding protein
MKRIALLSLLALTAILASACGASAPAADPLAQSGPAVKTTAQAPAAASGGTEVDVTLADNTINSSLTTFKAGVPYMFVIKNNGNHQHNFNVAPPVSVSGTLDASLAKALLVVQQNDLPVGGGKTVTYTFPDSAVGAQLEFSCLIPRHYEDGMRLAITVTK